MHHVDGASSRLRSQGNEHDVTALVTVFQRLIGGKKVYCLRESYGSFVFSGKLIEAELEKNCNTFLGVYQ